ncbi:Hypothetical predicted protein [Lecanosticta acicola]|uniref:Uncharacterized protein n=1 Tax=Lecanosticta acicola TaxID=111012 RepID=A0AAI9EFQ5_9PEZI|nr:Hypothetical predicted protein [Lecanosticta acicola]
MKARKPNTDQSAEFTAFANGEECTEFVLSAERDRLNMNIVECFIAVKPGDRITIKGKFSGSAVHGRFDLAVDGAFVEASVMEAKRDVISQEYELKFVKERKVAFNKVINLPIPPGWRSREFPKELYDGHLHTKQLDSEDVEKLGNHETAIRGGKKPGLGSIVVVVNINQSHTEIYDHESYFDMTVGSWRNRDSKLVRKSGIQPDLEMEFRQLDENTISAKRSKKHRDHFDQAKPGNVAWAKYVFYYRLREHIEAAGCSERPDMVQDLEDAEPNTFVAAAETTAGGRLKDPKAGDGDSEGSATNGFSNASESSPSPSSATKAKKRLGGSLHEYLKSETDNSSSELARERVSTDNMNSNGGLRFTAPPTMHSSPLSKMKHLGGTLDLPKDYIPSSWGFPRDRTPSVSVGTAAPMDLEPEPEPEPEPKTENEVLRFESDGNWKFTAEEERSPPRFEADDDYKPTADSRVPKVEAKGDNTTAFTPQISASALPMSPISPSSSRKRDASLSGVETPSKRSKSSIKREMDLRKAEAARKLEESKKKIVEEQAARQRAKAEREERKRAKLEQMEKDILEVEAMEEAALQAEQELLELQRAREAEEAVDSDEDEESEVE